MKITVNTRKPRNPLVAPAHFRRAGRISRAAVRCASKPAALCGASLTSSNSTAPESGGTARDIDPGR